MMRIIRWCGRCGSVISETTFLDNENAWLVSEIYMMGKLSNYELDMHRTQLRE